MDGWPQFVTLQPLGALRAWTAALAEHDGGKAYYCVRLFDEDKQLQTAELVAEVGAGDVRAQLAAVAAAGTSNTERVIDTLPRDLEAYRASRPFVAEAVARTERPDWAVRLAFEASDDRKRVLSFSVGDAILMRGRIASALVAISPWPYGLDVVRMWAEGDTAFSKIYDEARSKMGGLLAALLLLVLGDQLVWGASIGRDGLRGLVITLAYTPLSFALAYLSTWTWRAGMRRKLARFDEHAALERVAGGIARGLERNPLKLTLVLYSVRRYIATQVGATKPPHIEMGVLGARLANGQRWAAIAAGRDDTRGVRYFHILLFHKKRPIGDLYAEIDTTAFEGSHNEVKELTDRLLPIAESGVTNTSYRGHWRAPPAPPAPAPPPRPAITSPTPRMRELQRLLEKIARSGSAELNHEMWERYGAEHASPEERSKMKSLVAEATEAGNEARLELAALVERARDEAPDEFAAWVDAHDAYYAGYVDSDLAAEQRTQWAAVRTGKLQFVERPLAHLATDTERYRRLFGIDPASLADVDG